MPNPNPEYDAAWSRFLATDSLTFVPETLESAWAHGRERYLAFLIPVDNAAAVAHLRPIAERVGSIPGVESYPEDYWHITVKGAGFLVDEPSGSDELSVSAVDAAADHAASILDGGEQFKVTLGRANGFPEVVFMEAWDGGDVRRFNTALMERIPALPRYPFDGPRFLPHISIARFTSDEGLPRVKAVLSELRDSPPGPSFTATHIDLISAHLSAAAPTFELLRRYELSG